MSMFIHFGWVVKVEGLLFVFAGLEEKHVIEL